MKYKIFSGTLLILGTAVGAGMLGVPFVTAASGFLPAVFISGFVAFFMCLTGLLFLEVVLFLKKDAHFVSISQNLLGKKSARFVAGIFVFLYYCLLTAYFSVAGPLLAQVIRNITGYTLYSWQSHGLFALLFGSIVVLGIKWVDYCNYLAIAFMAICYSTLLFCGVQNIEFARLQTVDFFSSIWALPVLFSAFGYHNIIPSLAAYFSYERHVLQSSIIYGCVAVFFVYFFWQALILGSIPNAVFLEVAQQNNAMDIWQYLEKSGPFAAYFAVGFSFFAIVTSFFGVSFSMIDFLGDALKVKREGENRAALALLTFLPPMIIASTDPSLFIQALEVAGGVGEAILNGALPVLLAFVLTKKNNFSKKSILLHRNSLAVLYCIALGVLFLEVYALLSG